MTILDPTSNIGKMRLRCGDFSDLPIMPDEVYMSALDDCSGNLPQAVKLVCHYILASLTSQTHQKLAQVEVFGAEWFQNYVQFIKLTILNPNFMQPVPAPFSVKMKDAYGVEVCAMPIEQFQKDWNKMYAVTADEQNHVLAQVVNPYGVDDTPYPYGF